MSCDIQFYTCLVCEGLFHVRCCRVFSNGLLIRHPSVCTWKVLRYGRRWKGWLQQDQIEPTVDVLSAIVDGWWVFGYSKLKDRRSSFTSWWENPIEGAPYYVTWTWPEPGGLSSRPASSSGSAVTGDVNSPKVPRFVNRPGSSSRTFGGSCASAIPTPGGKTRIIFWMLAVWS